MIYYTHFGMLDTEIEKLLSDRSMARSQKDFKRADDIRKILHDRGIYIEDRSDGSVYWRTWG